MHHIILPSVMQAFLFAHRSKEIILRKCLNCVSGSIAGSSYACDILLGD